MAEQWIKAGLIGVIALSVIGFLSVQVYEINANQNRLAERQENLKEFRVHMLARSEAIVSELYKMEVRIRMLETRSPEYIEETRKRVGIIIDRLNCINRKINSGEKIDC